jgi:ATP/maltotriose-dependent transcriptional regulator MalT/DNA-binding SARP family transcriptional activator
MALAKTTPPTVPGAMPRPRLFRRLDRARAQPLTWVWGPPGAGKTTLVAGYLASRRLRAAWYQIDAGDGDVATFFYYLGRAAPRRRRPLPLLTPEYRPRLDVFARRYFRELYRRLGRRFVLVLDNYQELPEAALLHDVLRAAADELPAGGRLIVISRTAPPAALARLRVHRALDTVGWPELRLTLGEATRLVRRTSGRRRAAGEVRRLHALTDGWMAGLILLGLRKTGTPPASAGPDGAPVLFEYFAGEVLATRDRRERAVLLRTAFLPSVTPALAAAITGDAGAGEVIAGLHRRNYFIGRGAGPQGAYRYHPLFREFLLAEARRTLPAAQLAEVRRAAAALVEASGQLEAAADLLRDATDWEGLAGLIRRRAPALLAQGRLETVEHWLAGLPEAIFAGMPWLWCWQGLCRLGRRNHECRRDGERALAAFRSQRDTAGTLLAWSLIVTSYVMEGRTDALDGWIALLPELQDGGADPVPEDIEARVATTMLLAIAWRDPGHRDGHRWAERALDLTRRHPDRIFRTLACFAWFLLYWQRGDGARASLVIDEMRGTMRARDVAPLVAVHAAVPVAWYEALWALPSYRQTVAETRALALAAGLDHVVASSVLFYGAVAAVTQGDLDTGRAWLAEIVDTAGEQGPGWALACHAVLAIEALSRGDLEGATTHAVAIGRLGYTSGTFFEEVSMRLVAAHVCHERKDDPEARAHLELALALASRLPASPLAWMAHLTAAHMHLDRGRDAEGLEALAAAMALGRAGGFVNSQVWLPAVMGRLCTRALEAGLEVEYVRDLVRRRRLVPDPPPVETEAWPWPVKVFTLGRFLVVRNDRPLRSAGKMQRKPLALLKALAVLGTPGVREERLMDALWPDAEGHGARRALTSTVHRLRRLLGEDAAVVRRDGEIGLDPARCWVDVWAVTRLLDRAETVLAGGDRDAVWARARAWIDRAAQLHRGPLLGGDDDAAWSGSPADRLRRRLVRLALTVAGQLERAGDWPGAAERLETVLRIDPVAEDACRRLMVAYHRLGRPADVSAVYRRCREALARQAGLRPSAATDALLADLQNR